MAAAIALILFPLIAVFTGFLAWFIGLIINLINGLATGFLMVTGYIGIAGTKGQYYYICMAVQGISMILTFSILGEFVDFEIDKWLNNVWGGNLILAGVSIALAALVAFVLVKDAPNSEQEAAQVEF